MWHILWCSRSTQYGPGCCVVMSAWQWVGLSVFWCCGCLLWWQFLWANWGHLQEKAVNFFCIVYVSVVGWNSVIVWQKLLWTYWTCRCPVCWIILVKVWITTVLEWMDVGPETWEIVVFLQVAWWRVSSGTPNFLVMHVR